MVLVAEFALGRTGEGTRPYVICGKKKAPAFAEALVGQECPTHTGIAGAKKNGPDKKSDPDDLAKSQELIARGCF
jgi:hypothetical protein